MPATDPTRVYQAQGIAAVSDALNENGPIAPVPYFPRVGDRVTIRPDTDGFNGRGGATGTVVWAAPDLSDYQYPYGVIIDGEHNVIYFAAADFAPPVFTVGDRVDYHGYACAIKTIRGELADLRLVGHTHTDFTAPLAMLRPEPLIHAGGIR